MRVLMVTPSFLPIIGGTENIVESLALKLNEVGVSADVMALNMTEKWNPIWKSEIGEGNLKVFKIPAINVFHNKRFNPFEVLFGANVLPKLGFSEKFRDYDILHFHDDVDLSFPLFSFHVRKPKIFQCHTLAATYDKYRRAHLKRTILKNASSSFLTVSVFSKNLLANLGVPEPNIKVLYNGVDTAKFVPKKKENDNLLLFVGRLEERKGLSVLLESLKFLDLPVRLKVIGQGKDFQVFQNKFRSRRKQKIGIHEVEWLRTLDQTKLIEWFQRASIFVCPSLSEDFGVVNLEALACETPVVASKVGGIVEIVKNDVNGLVVPPHDPAKLASALRNLLVNETMREEYGRNGRRIVEKQFSIDTIVTHLRDIYDEAI